MWHASKARSQSCACMRWSRISNRELTEQEKYDSWRSETLIALTALDENEVRLEMASKRICNRLDDVFSPWFFEAGPFAKIAERFRLEILDPAIRLHQSLKSSSCQYNTRCIPDIDRLTHTQVLDEWVLKDADTWQRLRREKDVGKALYCLHPSVVRLGAEGAIAVVVAKPVIVVANSGRVRDQDSRSLKINSSSGMTAAPAAVESSYATDQIMLSHNQAFSTQVTLADRPSTLTDSDSLTDSGSRRLSHHKRKASTHPITNKQESLSESFRRRQSVPLDSFHMREDRPAHSKAEFDRQWSRRPKEDQDVQSYKRGHYIEGSSFTYQSQEAIRQPSVGTSKDVSDGRSSPRRYASENLQPSIAPPTAAPSTSSAKTRSLRERTFH